jgi:hypothetical protein
MMLSEPYGIVARGVHNGDALERHVVDGGERHRAVQPAEELQNADFHGGLPAYCDASAQLK